MLPEIRVSPRAKHVYLKMLAQGHLQIIVPRGYDLKKIPSLLERKHKWIEKTRIRILNSHSNFSPLEIEPLPTQIALPALGETWRVDYESQDSTRTILRQIDFQSLRLTGNVQQIKKCQQLLRRWLCRRGLEKLSPWLRKISEEIKLPFDRVSVRLQRSRWGSCSRRRTISINAKLLFLRPEIVRYLFIHELCHLAQMNHSRRYWALVESHEPNYIKLDTELRRAMQSLPNWVG